MCNCRRWGKSNFSLQHDKNKKQKRAWGKALVMLAKCARRYFEKIPWNGKRNPFLFYPFLTAATFYCDNDLRTLARAERINCLTIILSSAQKLMTSLYRLLISLRTCRSFFSFFFYAFIIHFYVLLPYLAYTLLLLRSYPDLRVGYLSRGKAGKRAW